MFNLENQKSNKSPYTNFFILFQVTPFVFEQCHRLQTRINPILSRYMTLCDNLDNLDAGDGWKFEFGRIHDELAKTRPAQAREERERLLSELRQVLFGKKFDKYQPEVTGNDAMKWQK